MIGGRLLLQAGKSPRALHTWFRSNRRMLNSSCSPSTSGTFCCLEMVLTSCCSSDLRWQHSRQSALT